VPSLAETQARLSAAILTGETAAIAPLLTGGRDPRARLAIHQRHYEASLVIALTTKFPATLWFIGDALFTAAARAFVYRHPPAAPCIAEYAEDFPRFIAAWPGAEHAPYLGAVAEADWLLGQAALAVEQPALSLQALAAINAEKLPDVVLSLQRGLRFMQASWPIDELLELHLGDDAPERYELNPEDVWLEIRGTRGAFGFQRLDRPSYLFRRAVKAGAAIGDAAEQALAADPSFDAGAALAALFADGVVTSVSVAK
jgi:Putative DNA-binding domain